MTAVSPLACPRFGALPAQPCRIAVVHAKRNEFAADLVSLERHDPRLGIVGSARDDIGSRPIGSWPALILARPERGALLGSADSPRSRPAMPGPVAKETP